MTEKSMEKSFFPTYVFLCVANLLLFMIGIRLFAEQFSLRHHHFSELGNIRSPSGYPNLPSQIVFSFQMLFNSIFFFQAGKKIYYSDCRHPKLYQGFCRSAGSGTLLIILPYGINNFVHSLGMIVLSVSILVMNTITFVETRHKQNDSSLKTVCVLSWAMLLVYAVLCGMDHPAKFAVQKPAVLILGIYILAASPYIAKLSPEEAEVSLTNGEEQFAETAALKKVMDSDD